MPHIWILFTSLLTVRKTALKVALIWYHSPPPQFAGYRSPQPVEFHSAHARGLGEQIFALDWHKVDESFGKLAFRSLRFLVVHRAQGQPPEVSQQGRSAPGEAPNTTSCTVRSFVSPSGANNSFSNQATTGTCHELPMRVWRYITIFSSLLFALWKARSCIPNWEPHCCFLLRNVRETPVFHTVDEAMLVAVDIRRVSLFILLPPF